VFRFIGFGEDWVKLTMAYLAAHLFTGLLNDYFDFDLDIVDQPNKPSSKNIVTKVDIRSAMILILIVFGLVLLTFPLEIKIILLIGLVLAQTYNLKLKDSPFSIIVFALAFSFMFIPPFYLKYKFDLNTIPIIYVVSCGIIVILLHFANDLMDFDIDKKRKSHSFIQVLGEEKSYTLMILLAFIYIILNLEHIFVILGYLPSIAIIIFSSSFLKKQLDRQVAYYVLSILYFFQIAFLPIDA